MADRDIEEVVDHYARPPIPARLAHRPTRNGMALPWGNAALADGGVDFRSHHATRRIQAWTRGLCQVCGQTLTHPAVLLCSEARLRDLVFEEPPLHPECAVYTTKVCPMVAGERTHYVDRPIVSAGKRGEKCFELGCDCGGWVQHPGPSKAGQPAPAWYAVYVRTCTRVYRPDGDLIGGLCTPDEVLVVRLVSRPGEGRCWAKVTDWRERYEPPDLVGPG